MKKTTELAEATTETEKTVPEKIQELKAAAYDLVLERDRLGQIHQQIQVALAELQKQ